MFTGKWKILLFVVISPLCCGSQIPSLHDTVVLSIKCAEQYQLKQYNQAYYYCLPRARQNDPDAQYYVGMMTEQGLGTKLDHDKALKWFTLAADAGHGDAQLKLGKLYNAGIWVTKDDAKAAHYYFLSAKQNVSEAQYLLALCYQLGMHLKKDEKSAHFWYTQAIKNGLKGKPLALSDLSAAKLMTKSWPGNEEYQMVLSLKKEKQSQSVEDMIFDWLRVAAEKGHPQAQYELAVYFEKGTLVPQDDGAAYYWFEKAAKNHHPAAQGYLAWMTLLGLGIHDNLTQSLAWFASEADL